MQRIQDLFDRGELDEARQQLHERIAQRQDAFGDHAAEARLAERLGMSSAAVRAWQLVLRDEPECAEAWRALAELHAERGEVERAAACRRWLAESEDEPQPPPCQPPSEEVTEPCDADLVRFVHLFRGREEVHARMWFEPDRGVGYSPVRQALTPDLARAHVQGTFTAGIYLLTADEEVWCLVLDLDATKASLERALGDRDRTRSLREAIHSEGLRLFSAARADGLDPLLVDSGHKGRHLWFFLEQAASADEGQGLARGLAARYGCRDPRLTLECFPKQGHLRAGGLGNLVKLPLGIHLRTGRRCAILGEDGVPDPDPLARLRQIVRVAPGRVSELVGSVPDEAARPSAGSALAPPSPPARRREPEWSEADLEASSEVGPVLGGCAVLRSLVEDALKQRRLDREAVVVLNHTLGHLPDGVRALRYIYEQIPGLPADALPGRPHRGSPSSCARIRKHLPGLTSRVPCACTFPADPGAYAHPLRFLTEIPDPDLTRTTPPLDELLERYGRALDRLGRIQAEADALRASVVEALDQVPGGRWSTSQGEWRLVHDSGDPVLEWHPPTEESS